MTNRHSSILARIEPLISATRHCLLPTIIALGCFALSPHAGAQCRDGCDNALLNTFLGSDALSSNPTGSDNTAIGGEALGANSTGNENTATGHIALTTNTSGDDNTAVGDSALASNTTASGNTATGASSLLNNSTGFDNVASGFEALKANTTGSGNVADGVQALYSNTSGANNTAVGPAALYSNVNGDGNTAIGNSALARNMGGGDNIAIGNAAGYNLTTGNGNVDIANQGVAGESGKIRIGTKGSQTATFIAGIFGKTVKNSTAVFINGNGQLGTVQSSARFKDDIKPMDAASQAILKLHPVTFRYKEEVDPDKAPQFGLVAEDVEKVAPELVVHDEAGKPFTVRYEAVNAMLLNEFLKEHHKTETLEATVAQQHNQIEALTAGLQKVSEEVQLSQATSRSSLADQ